MLRRPATNASIEQLPRNATFDQNYAGSFLESGPGKYRSAFWDALQPDISLMLNFMHLHFVMTHTHVSMELISKYLKKQNAVGLWSNSMTMKMNYRDLLKTNMIYNMGSI